jgi:hypothetical protein
MMFFKRKITEEERMQENSRCDEDKTSKKEIQSRSKRGELDCEEAIIQDKERFGRVRKSLMMYLREEYGRQVADRALWRVNRRRTEKYFKIQ